MVTVLLALGSNRPIKGGVRDFALLSLACEHLSRAGLSVIARSRFRYTPPMGKKQRRFVNGVVAVQTLLDPPALLRVTQAIEVAFGRRGGHRWGPRSLDIDILSWGASSWPTGVRWRRARGLRIPHPAMQQRDFVLRPLLDIAPEWRHPIFHLTARQLHARLNGS